jgi:hypothetical protein
MTVSASPSSGPGGTCQVANCTHSVRVELAVADGLVLDVCRSCASEETVRAYQKGSNVGLYSYLGKPIVIACEGDPPIPRGVAFIGGIPRWCEAPPTWSAYTLPCSHCFEEFIHDPAGRVGRASLLCENCGSQSDVAPRAFAQITEDQAATDAHAYAAQKIAEGNVSAKDEIANFDRYETPWGRGRPLWEKLPNGMVRQAAIDAYEERAAIKEYDGGLPRMIAEKEAYEEISSKAIDAGLVTHEQLNLFG